MQRRGLWVGNKRRGGQVPGAGAPPTGLLCGLAISEDLDCYANHELEHLRDGHCMGK